MEDNWYSFGAYVTKMKEEVVEENNEKKSKFFHKSKQCWAIVNLLKPLVICSVIKT